MSNLLLNNLQKIVRDIESTKKYNDIKCYNLSYFFKHKKYFYFVIELFAIFFRIICWQVFFCGKDKFLKYLVFGKSLLFDSIDVVEIKKVIRFVEDRLSDVKWINRKLFFVKLISDCKNYIMFVDFFGKSKKFDNLNSCDKILFLKKLISPWDIILLHKRFDNWLGTILLKYYDKCFPVNFTHVVLVSNKDNKWNVSFIHSTIKKELSKWWWVEEVDLDYYIKKYKSLDFLVLRQWDTNKQKSIDSACSNIWKKYDNKVAFVSGLWKKRFFGKNVFRNDKYNCAELLTQIYQDDNKIKNISHPNDFLKYDIFVPIYIWRI